MDPSDTLLELLGDAADLVPVDEFRVTLLAALRRALVVDWISLNDIGPDPESVVVIADPPPPPELLGAFAAYAHQNPLVAHYARTRNGRALRFSDLVTGDELHALDLYREVYEPLGVEYQLAFTLPHGADRILGIALSRRAHDFSDAERDLVERARPFMITAYRNAIRYTEARAGSGPSTEALVSRGLTRRQAEVLRELALGASERDIAGRLGISPRTVEKHLELCYRTLGVTNRAQAAAIAWSS